MTATHRYGTVAIVGRPNVGKSTLLNRLVGVPVSIVTPKAQTTRNRIAGICTLADAQVVLLDTPGLPRTARGLAGRLRRIAEDARLAADVVALVVDVQTGIGAIERAILGQLAPDRAVVAINKLDAVTKSAALPLLAAVASYAPGVAAVPISARTGLQVDVLLDEMVARLPCAPPGFSPDEYTTASTRFLVQELIREQVFLQTHEEVPYGAAVIVESFEEGAGGIRIAASILVQRAAHKAILVGARGQRIKAIGTRAREAAERLLGVRVHLALDVRVEADWTERPERLVALELA